MRIGQQGNNNNNQQIVWQRLAKHDDLRPTHQLRCAHCSRLLLVLLYNASLLLLFSAPLFPFNYFQLLYYDTLTLSFFSLPPTLAHCCAQLLLFITICHKFERQVLCCILLQEQLQSFAINNNNAVFTTTAITHTVMRIAQRFDLRSGKRLLIAGTYKRQQPSAMLTHTHAFCADHKNLLHFSRFTRT